MPTGTGLQRFHGMKVAVLDMLAWENIKAESTERYWAHVRYWEHLILAICVVFWACLVLFLRMRAGVPNERRENDSHPNPQRV